MSRALVLGGGGPVGIAWEAGLLAGLALPVQPMEHHYLITEAIPEIEAHGKEIAVTVDYEGNAYTRQEGKGLLLGTYESNCVPWSAWPISGRSAGLPGASGMPTPSNASSAW